MQRANQLLHSLRGALASEQRGPILQKKLARLLDVAEPTMSRWLTGKARLGQIELLLRLLEQLPPDRWQREIAEVLPLRAGLRFKRRSIRRKLSEKRQVR